MRLSGSKVIAVVCIATAFSSTTAVLSEVQKQNVSGNNYHTFNTSSFSYELNILSEFLDHNQLHHAIIIYTSSTPTAHSDNELEDKFLQMPFIRKLTSHFHIQFINTLSRNSSPYLLRSLIRGAAVFMKYKANDRGKESILDLASRREKFNKSLKWLLLLEGLTQPLLGIQQQLGHLNLSLDADVTVAVQQEKSYSDLYDVYKICGKCDHALEVAYKGHWTASDGLTILKDFRYGIALRRNNFEMFPIKATTTISNKSPTLNMSDMEYLNNDKVFLDEDTMQRKTYQLMKIMQDLYNFTFDIRFADGWGALVNGSWRGATGLLYNKEVEMTLCPLRYVVKRLEACIYTGTIHAENIQFLFRHPKHTSIRNIFFEPLDDIVWWCVLALIFVAILLLAIHVHAEYRMYKMLQERSVEGDVAANAVQLPVENHFDFIVLCILEAILMQGPDPELFRHNSTRLLVVSVSIFSILLMQFYGAFIVSSLLSEAPRTITNMRALYNSSLMLAIENVSYHYDIFMNNTNPMLVDLYKYRIVNKHSNRANSYSLEEGVKKIGEGNFAFHVAVDRAYRLLKTSLTESQFCDLQEVQIHSQFAFSTGIGMRRGTPYYEFITSAVAKFQEAALLPYNNKKWAVEKIDCSSVQDGEVEVDLVHFAPALAFLFCATLTSLLALAIEIIYKKFPVKF